MSGRRPHYAPLRRDSRSRSAAEPDPELDAAFGLSDDDDDDDENQTETTPLTHTYTPTDSSTTITPAPPTTRPSVSIPTSTPTPTPPTHARTATYDFERDYAYDYASFPPPGSPPGPSTTARPNDYGNSNGLIPSFTSTPPSRPLPHQSRPSVFRRAVAALWPRSPYARLATSADDPEAAGSGTRRSAPRGSGMENDGVFANVMAKPGRAVEVRGEDGEVYMVPEETQKEMPPSYTEAQLDAAPSYWETTVHAPLPLDPDADMIVDDLPTGSLITFIATGFISYFFSFVGFVLTYLLHTTHAAKYGSRAGLGITLIQYGFFSRSPDEMSGGGTGAGEVVSGSGNAGDGAGQYVLWNLTSGTTIMVDKADVMSVLNAANGTLLEWGEVGQYNISSRDWLSLLFMTLGWFLLLSSLVGFYRVKRWEYSIRGSASASASASSPSAPARPERFWTNPFAILATHPLYAEAEADAREGGGEAGVELEHIDSEALRREMEAHAMFSDLAGMFRSGRAGGRGRGDTEEAEEGEEGEGEARSASASARRSRFGRWNFASVR